MRFRSGTLPGQIDAPHRALDARIVGEIAQIAVQVVEVPSGVLSEHLQAYIQSPLTQFAEPDYLARAVLVPNDPRYSKQWGLRRISAPRRGILQPAPRRS